MCWQSGVTCSGDETAQCNFIHLHNAICESAQCNFASLHSAISWVCIVQFCESAQCNFVSLHSAISSIWIVQFHESAQCSLTNLNCAALRICTVFVALRLHYCYYFLWWEKLSNNKLNLTNNIDHTEIYFHQNVSYYVLVHYQLDFGLKNEQY